MIKEISQNEDVAAATAPISPVEKAIILAQEKMNEAVASRRRRTPEEEETTESNVNAGAKSESFKQMTTSFDDVSPCMGMGADTEAVFANADSGPEPEPDLSFYERQWKMKQNPPLPISEWSMAFPNLILLDGGGEKSSECTFTPHVNADADAGVGLDVDVGATMSENITLPLESDTSTPVDDKMKEVRSRLKELVREDVVSELKRRGLVTL